MCTVREGGVRGPGNRWGGGMLGVGEVRRAGGVRVVESDRCENSLYIRYV